MIRAASIFLCNQISVRDAQKLADWLDDSEVSMYLNEERNISSSLRRMADEKNVMLTYHLNREGRFYVVRKSEDEPVGFIRLQPDKSGCSHEIVIAIGDRSIWGKGIGSTALRQSLNLAFYEWRTRKVIARIHNENHRSVRLFTKAGFKIEREMTNLKEYSLTIDRFIGTEAKRA